MDILHYHGPSWSSLQFKYFLQVISFSVKYIISLAIPQNFIAIEHIYYVFNIYCTQIRQILYTHCLALIFQQDFQ